jgi:hypothetical protein
LHVRLAVCGSIIVPGNFAAKDIVDEMSFVAFEHPIGDNIGCNGLLAANFWQFVLC